MPGVQVEGLQWFPTGGGEFSFPLANDTKRVGTSLYGQVLVLEPRLLTSDWLKLTYLP